MSKITRTPIQALAALTLTLTLAACGSTTPDTSTGGGTGTQATKFGVVMLTEDLASTSMKVMPLAMFLEFSESIPAARQDPYATLKDTCEVTNDTVTDPGTTPEVNATPLDAGAAITVTANGEAYTSFSRQTLSGTVFYEAATPAPTSVPTSGLMVNVPGATGGLASFGTVAIPDTPALSVRVTPDTSVTKDTSFTWDDTTGGVVVLTGSAYIDEGLPVDFTCYAKDDGYFVFPEATKDDLTAKGFVHGYLDSAMRVNHQVHQKDGSVLMTAVARIQAFGSPSR